MKCQTLTFSSERKLEQTPEASGLALLAGGALLVVDDGLGLFVYGPEGAGRRLPLGAGISDLEGLCLLPGGRSLLLLAESISALFRVELTGQGPDLALAGAPVEVGRLPPLEGVHNRGWEGVQVRPGPWWPDGRDRLVAAHQAEPHRLALLDLQTLAVEQIMTLPHDARQELGSLNDVAVHPDTGRLWVLSGGAARLAELDVIALDDGPQLDLRGLYKVKRKHKHKHYDHDRPEGICFDDRCHPWLVTDGKGHLLGLK